MHAMLGQGPVSAPSTVHTAWPAPARAASHRSAAIPAKRRSPSADPSSAIYPASSGSTLVSYRTVHVDNTIYALFRRAAPVAGGTVTASCGTVAAFVNVKTIPTTRASHSETIAAPGTGLAQLPRPPPPSRASPCNCGRA